jgi:hypothetical protein
MGEKSKNKFRYEKIPLTGKQGFGNEEKRINRV